jgi:hypothetical protein
MGLRTPSTVALVFVVGLIAICVPTPAQSSGCSRECLRGLLDSYLLAMSKHDASKLAIASTAKFTENGQPLKLGEGFWTTAGTVKYRLYALDPQEGGAAVQAVVREGSDLTTFLLRIKVTGQKIIEAETIVCRKGQSDFFAPDKLIAPPLMFNKMVSTAERHTRKELIAAADAYFTALQTQGTPAYRPAPLADDAERFENGLQTTNVPVLGQPAAKATEQLDKGYDKGYFKGLTLTKRRFPLVDVDHGIVLAVALVRTPNPDGILLSEMFHVTGGQIRQIQAVLVNIPHDAATGW